jgi:general stress protein 26
MNDDLKDFYEMVEELETAMFTTRRPDGRLVSRPMATQARADGADLWFVTSRDTDKLEEIAFDPQVNLAYYKDGSTEWISVSGTAKTSTDRGKIRELHRADWEIYFPDEGGEKDGGPDDPRLVLVGVDIESARFMEVNKPKAVVLFELARASVTGGTPDIAEIRDVDRAEVEAGRRSGG